MAWSLISMGFGCLVALSAMLPKKHHQWVRWALLSVGLVIIAAGAIGAFRPHDSAAPAYSTGSVGTNNGVVAGQINGTVNVNPQSSYAPRHLTPEQRSTIMSKLAASDIQVIVSVWEANCSDCEDFGGELVDAINASGKWKVARTGIVYGPGKDTISPTGIGVHTSELGPNQTQIQLYEALAQAGIDRDYVKFKDEQALVLGFITLTVSSSRH